MGKDSTTEMAELFSKEARVIFVATFYAKISIRSYGGPFGHVVFLVNKQKPTPASIQPENNGR